MHEKTPCTVKADLWLLYRWDSTECVLEQHNDKACQSTQICKTVGIEHGTSTINCIKAQRTSRNNYFASSSHISDSSEMYEASNCFKKKT